MELLDAVDFARTTRQSVLTTVRGDGRPQLSNVFHHVFDDGIIRISITDSRAKTTNMRRDPRVSLHVNRSDFYAYAVIEAEADLAPVAAAVDDATVDELVDYYRSVAGEHPDWDEYRQAMVDDGRLLLKLTPTRAYGMVG